MPLPSNPPIGADWRVLGDTPLDFWLPTLELLRERHRLPAGDWRRVTYAKNVVFALDDLFLKLIPPYWDGDARREAAALRLLAGRLPGSPLGAAPPLLAADAVDGWSVVLIGRLPGRMLAEIWRELPRDQQLDLARQNGALAAGLQAQPVAAEPTLAIDWAGRLERQRAELLADLPRAAMPAALEAGLADFLARVGPLPTPGSRPALLHGDLSLGNLLVEPVAGGWRICGLIDFGDASIGEGAHELLSPNINVYHGDAGLLQAFYAGYGLAAADQTIELARHLTARALLYYGWPELAAFLPAGLASWDAVAAALWAMGA